VRRQERREDGGGPRERAKRGGNINTIKEDKKEKSRVDDIGGEAWLYSNGRIKERLKDLLKRKGEGFPKEWRKGVITPIHKKGD